MLSFDCLSQGLTIDAIKRYALKNNKVNGDLILNDIKLESQEENSIEGETCDEDKKKDKELELIFVASVSDSRKGEVTRFESSHDYYHPKYNNLEKMLEAYGVPSDEIRKLSPGLFQGIARVYR